jgi:hypothetical protein
MVARRRAAVKDVLVELTKADSLLSAGYWRVLAQRF